MATRYYSLFRRLRGTKGKWERIDSNSYAKKTAVRVYQNRLLASAFGEIDPEYEYQMRVTQDHSHWPDEW